MRLKKVSYDILIKGRCSAAIIRTETHGGGSVCCAATTAATLFSMLLVICGVDSKFAPPPKIPLTADDGWMLAAAPPVQNSTHSLTMNN